MKETLLASHGRLAERLLGTLQIFCGELQQIQALCLLPDGEITEFMEELEATIQKTDAGKGVVTSCNLLFGSPCNCSARLLQDVKHVEKVNVITRMNLCMVLEYVDSGAAGMSREVLVDTGHRGIVDFNKLLRECQTA